MFDHIIKKAVNSEMAHLQREDREKFLKLANTFIAEAMIGLVDASIDELKETYAHFSDDSDSHCLEEECYIDQVGGYNEGVSDCIQTFKSFKNKLASLHNL